MITFSISLTSIDPPPLPNLPAGVHNVAEIMPARARGPRPSDAGRWRFGAASRCARRERFVRRNAGWPRFGSRELNSEHDCGPLLPISARQALSIVSFHRASGAPFRHQIGSVDARKSLFLDPQQAGFFSGHGGGDGHTN